VDSFYWSEAEDKVASLGLLTESKVDQLGDYRWVGVSVCPLETYRTDVELLGEITTAWFVKLYLGDNPHTGEEIIGDFFIGTDDWSLPLYRPRGYVTPFDPNASDSESSPNGTVLTAVDFVEKLEVGKLYPIELLVETVGTEAVDCSLARDEQRQWKCLVITTQFEEEQIAYNRQLYHQLLGNSAEVSDASFGWLGTLYFVPIWSE